MTEREWKRETIKQYLRYFRIWFLILGIVLVVFLGKLGFRLTRGEAERGNTAAPAERVYDYADVLSDEEEAALRQLIATKEGQIACDIVLVTVREEIGERPSTREQALRDLADNFYDDNNFGYDRIHGDGVLLMDNWYEGQMSTWLSTCGAAGWRFDDRRINDVLDAVYRYIDNDPYRAYRAYVEETASIMSGESRFSFFPILILILPLVVMLVFVCGKLKSPLGEDTAPAMAYVVGGQPAMRVQTDQLKNRLVSRRRIPKPSGGGGSGHGGGGGHVSSGGVHHGGGGRSR